ncbi:hypothetical protein Tco_0646784 [Tanacetum coccineum]
MLGYHGVLLVSFEMAGLGPETDYLSQRFGYRIDTLESRSLKLHEDIKKWEKAKILTLHFSPFLKIGISNATTFSNITGDDVGKDNDRVNSSPTMFTPGNSVVNKEDNLRGVNDGLKTKCAAYPVVANYDRNTWGKYGLVKSMLNSSTRILSFQFSSMEDVNLLKEDVGNVLVLVKLHGVPVTAFSGDGLSVIATNLGTPLMLNSYTLNVCDPIMGVLVNSSGNLISGIWNLSSTSTTHIIEKIDKVERLIIKGKVTLVDDESKPVTKVDSFDDHDNEDEVVSTDIDIANFLASKKEGYGTNSLLEQWNESYVNRTDNQEKDEKQRQNDKTGLGMEKTVKDKAKSKPESQSSQKVNRKVNWLNLLHLIVNLEAFEVISSYKLIELIAQGIEAREPLGQLFRPLTQKEWPWF